MPTFHSWSGCHEYCIIDNVIALMDRGYTCYLEYELMLDEKKKAVVDIYGTRNDEKILIEVGYLSQIHGDRIQLLKSLIPEAKIIHVYQWKNYFSVYDRDEEYIRWQVMKYAWKKDQEMYSLLADRAIEPRDALGLAAQGIKWNNANDEMGMSMGKNLNKKTE